MLKPCLPVWGPFLWSGLQLSQFPVRTACERVVMLSSFSRGGKDVSVLPKFVCCFILPMGLCSQCATFPSLRDHYLPLAKLLSVFYPLFCLSFFFSLSALKAPFRNRRRSVAIVNSRPRLASPRTNEHSLRLTLPSYRKEPKA